MCVNMKLKLITFDVTGTILTFRDTVGHHYAKVGSYFGVQAQPNVLTDNFKKVFKQMLTEHPNFGQVTGIGWEEWWRKLVSRTFKYSLPDIKVEHSKLDLISARLIDIYKTSECWELRCGAKDLLGLLKKRDISLGVISNYDPRLKDILKELDILHYFKFVLSSYEVKCQKPDTSIFRIAEEINKNMTRNEMLHIGDSALLDYMGAKNAGWNAVLITQDRKKIHELYPDIDKKNIVSNTNELWLVLQDCIKQP